MNNTHQPPETQHLPVIIIGGGVHKAVRVVACVRVPRQIALPVRCDQGKGIPAFMFPAMHQGIFFQHEMFNVLLLQKIAGAESGLTATDDDDWQVLCV